MRTYFFSIKFQRHFRESRLTSGCDSGSSLRQGTHFPATSFSKKPNSMHASSQEQQPIQANRSFREGRQSQSTQCSPQWGHCSHSQPSRCHSPSEAWHSGHFMFCSSWCMGNLHRSLGFSDPHIFSVDFLGATGSYPATAGSGYRTLNLSRHRDSRTRSDFLRKS